MRTNMNIRKEITTLLVYLSICATTWAQYNPTTDNLEARRIFSGFRFGIFLHWGIYSEFAQGEWYLNAHLNKDEYAKAASCFYPIQFNADEWVSAIKDAGARYITFTSRHHDGFSMFRTAESDYNIVDATPFKRDVLKELADACQQQDVRLHVYYSILDWIRPDYPIGRTGLYTGRDLKPDYDSYFQFMKNQVHELLTQYPNIEGLWFDGYWDHDQDTVPFDWRMPEFYRYIHQIKPRCLIGNNHHITPLEGEDFQMFERDLPGENRAGLSGQAISQLPLEMCQTMNDMWGYKVADQNYKSADKLIELIVRAAAKGSNLLLNIGPQPNGELPATALNRLKEIGKWMRCYSETIYDTNAYGADCSWGVCTAKGKQIFAHVLNSEAQSIELSVAKKPSRIEDFITHNPLPFHYDKKKGTVTITIQTVAKAHDRVITILTK